MEKLFYSRDFLPAALVLLLAVLFFSPGPALAEEEVDPLAAETGETAGSAPPELKLPGVKGVDVTHAYLSNTVEQLSQRIDRFFGEERVYEEATGTYIQARGSLIYSEGGESVFDGKFRVKVDLPQLEEKVNFVLESADERDESEEGNRITTGTSVDDEIDDNDITAALQFIMKKKEKWNFSIRPGIKLANPVEAFVKFRYRQFTPLGDKWLSRGTVKLEYYTDDGWENDWALDFERAIGDDYLFRSASTVHWEEAVPGNQLLIQTFQFSHFIDRRQSLAFEIGSTAETRPKLNDLSYFSSLRYRKDIHRGWLFLELKPQIIYRRETGWKDEPAFVVSLEALLGAKYLE